MSNNTKFKFKTKDDSGAEDIDSHSELESNEPDTPKEDEHESLTNLSLGGGVKRIFLPRIPANSARDLVVEKKPKISTKFLVNDAITKLAEPNGSSLIAIKKYITANSAEKITVRLNGLIKRYIKKAVDEGKIIQNKGHFELPKKMITVKQKSNPKPKVKTTKKKSKTTELKSNKLPEKSSMKNIENGKIAKSLAKAVNSKISNKERTNEKINKEKKLSKEDDSNGKLKLKRKSIVTAKTTMTATKTQIENKSKSKRKLSTNKKEPLQPKVPKAEYPTKKGSGKEATTKKKIGNKLQKKN